MVFVFEFVYIQTDSVEEIKSTLWDVDVACSSHVTPTTNRITEPFEGCDAVLFFTGVTIRYAPSSTVLVDEKVMKNKPCKCIIPKK